MGILAAAALCVGIVCVVRYVWQPRRWRATLSDPYYELTRTGFKSLEGRRNFDKWKYMRSGDIIEFSHATNAQQPSFSRVIRKRHVFMSFREALQHFERMGQLHRMLPNVDSVEEGVAVYAKFVSLGTQVRDGVVILELGAAPL